MYEKNLKHSGIVRFMLHLAAAVMMLVFCFSLPVGDAGAVPGTITAEAASKTAVKSLAVGKSYTVSGYAKVKSSKTSVATAKKKSSKKYTVTAKKKGTTTLKCYNSSGKLVKTIYLITTNSGSFKYDTTAVTLKKGSTKMVKATVQSGCTVKYSSSNKSVATVSSKGKITAKGNGTAVISAKVYYKGKKIKTLKKTVTVGSTTALPSGDSDDGSSTDSSNATITYDTSMITISPGKSASIAVSVPDGYTVKYSSSDTGVVTVDANGTVTAVANGGNIGENADATITVKVYKGSTLQKSFSKKVKVRFYTITGNFVLEPYVGSSYTFSYGYYDYDLGANTYSTDDSFVIESSNTSVVDVTPSANTATIKAVAYGSATVTCKVNGIVCSSLTLNTQLTESERLRTPVDSQYSYELYLVGADKLFSETNVVIYIKTDNPDCSTVELGFDYVTAEGKKTFAYNIEYEDIDYTELREYQAVTTGTPSSGDYVDLFGNLSSVEGGYVCCVSISNSGEVPMYVIEKDSSGNRKCVAKFVANVADYDETESSWINWLIDNCTTSDMDSFEKMDAICSYLSPTNSGFSYDRNYNGNTIYLTSDNLPCFVCKMWDSCTSPAELAKIAEAIGGFDYINNLYDDYEYGSSEWKIAHSFVEVGIGEQIKRHSVCPSSQTGLIDSWNMVDFSSSEYLTRVDQVDNSFNWEDIYPTPSASMASTTEISVASLDGETCETELQETENNADMNQEEIENAEAYEIEISLFDEDSVQEVDETGIESDMDGMAAEEIIIEDSSDEALIVEEEIPAE